MEGQTTQDSLQLAQQWFDIIGPFFGGMLLRSTLWALFFSLLGLLLAIIVMRMIHRRGLLRRSPRWWNAAAKSSYLLVLIAIPLTSALGGMFYGMQRTLEESVTEQVEPALAAQMPALRSQLAERLGPMASDTMITARDLVRPMVQDFFYQPTSQATLEVFKTKLINEYLLKYAARALTQAFQQSMKHLPVLLPSSGNSAQDELLSFTVATAIKVLSGVGEHVDFTSLDRSVPEIFGDAMRQQISTFFTGIYIGLGIKLLLLTMIIGAEMLFYFKYYFRKRNQIAVEPV
jgi:hypothetical protein